MPVHRLLVPLLTALALLPAAPVAAAGPPVEVTAAVRTADGLVFVTEQVSTRVRGLDRVRQLRRRAGVVAAEVAIPVRALAADPLRDRQWGLTRLSAEQTWAQGSATGTVVAVVDTGVDASHPDLAAVTLPGLDLVGNGDGRTDANGHGTHVAGVVAAVAGNGVGGAGLAQGAQVLPVAALDATGSGYDADVARGITWAVDQGAAVVNLSLGGERASSLLTAAVRYALDNGTVVVAAAGNAGAAGDPVLYPAATPGVVAVGAVRADDTRPAWSSSGDHLALAAPGAGILSTVPGGWSTWDGTSMAAPFVAAAAALVVADEPALTPAQVRERLMTTARDLGAPGTDRYTGAGLVDVVAARSVSRPAAVPAAAPAASPLADPSPSTVAEPAASPSAEPSPSPVAPPVAEPSPASSPAAPPSPAAPAPTSSPDPVAAPRASSPEPPPVASAPVPAAPAPEPVTAPVPAPAPAAESAPAPAPAPVPAVESAPAPAPAQAPAPAPVPAPAPAPAQAPAPAPVPAPAPAPAAPPPPAAPGPGPVAEPRRHPTLAVTAVRVSRSAAVVLPRRPVVLAARAVAGDAPAAGRSAVLERRVGSGPWSVVRRGTTRPDGLVFWTLQPDRSGTHRVRVEEFVSASVTVDVRQAVSAAARRSGRNAVVDVRVAPGGRTPVVLQVLGRTGWTTVARATTGSAGTVRLVRPLAAGSRIRVLAAARPQLLSATSPLRRV